MIFVCLVCGDRFRCPRVPSGVEWRLLDARMGWHAVQKHDYPRGNQ